MKVTAVVFWRNNLKTEIITDILDYFYYINIDIVSDDMVNGEEVEQHLWTDFP